MAAPTAIISELSGLQAKHQKFRGGKALKARKITAQGVALCYITPAVIRKPCKGVIAF